MEDKGDKVQKTQKAQQKEESEQDSGLTWPELTVDRAKPGEKIMIDTSTAQPSTPKPEIPERLRLPSDDTGINQDPYNTHHYAKGANPFDPKTSRTSRGSQ